MEFWHLGKAEVNAAPPWRSTRESRTRNRRQRHGAGVNQPKRSDIGQLAYSIRVVRRDLKELAARTFDLLVIGGGIYGAIATWDAALRGLSVGIIDRGDFGGGTSFNSAKTVHGGVRALQSGNVAALRRFVRERRALSRVLPHLVEPLPFVIPTYRGISRNRVLLRLYFAINDLLAHDRNLAIPGGRRLPASRTLSRDECLELNPLIDPRGVSGGIEWHDCRMYNSDRVHFSFIASAIETGAVAANYVEATAAFTRGSAVKGVQAIDRLGGQSFDIRARVVLNAAGPWAPELDGRLVRSAGGRLYGGLTKAMNFVIASPLGGTHAVAGQTAGRFLFVAPWREFAIVGTSYDRHAGGADELGLDRGEIDTFIAAANRAFPKLGLDAGDLRLVHRGLLPVSAGGDGLKRETTSTIVDHRRAGIHGLISVLGVRYTTARYTAERAVDMVLDQLRCTARPCRTATTPLVGGDLPDVDAFLRDASRPTHGWISGATRRRLARTYGTRYGAVVDRLLASEDDGAALGATCPVTVGEIRHAVQEEMAVRLSDALLRRTEAGSAGSPGEDAVATAARVMAVELGWTRQRIATEISALHRAYRIPD